MNGKTIAVLEDDYYQAEGLRLVLEKKFPQCDIQLCRTEEEFDRCLGAVSPDVAIVDWIVFKPGDSSEDSYTAGMRAIRGLLERPGGRYIPVIIRTLLAAYIVAPYVKQLGAVDVPVVGKSVNDDERLVKILHGWLSCPKIV